MPKLSETASISCISTCVARQNRQKYVDLKLSMKPAMPWAARLSETAENTIPLRMNLQSLNGNGTICFCLHVSADEHTCHSPQMAA